MVKKKKLEVGKDISESEYLEHQKGALSNFGGLSEEDLDIWCDSCKHFKHENICKAFPGGIPLDIIVERDFHLSVRPDQVGKKVYEPKNEGDKEIIDMIKNIKLEVEEE